MELLNKGERLRHATFVPRVGDKIEFRSDIQTEKGPSTGSVIAVDRDVRTAIIKHSDHPGEIFDCNKIKVIYFTIRHDDPLWVLE